MKLSGHWAHHLHHALHHFAVALVLASAVLILEVSGHLNWLDSLSLRAVGTLQSSESSADKLNPNDAPVSLLIGDGYFENEFRQESPLDRRELTRLVERVLQAQPTLLAIDIDLSPGPAGSLGNAGQEELDAFLVHAALANRVPIILTAPFPVTGEKLLMEKHAWLVKMCNAGIAIAYPHIVLSQGLVMRYPFRQPSLGLVASKSGAARAVGHTLCQEILAGPEKSLFLSKAFSADLVLGADDLRSQRPINPEYLRNSSSMQSVIQGAGDNSFASSLRGRPVFLGSQFDSRDEFMTPYGKMKGTVIHAATFYSERKPTHAVTHGTAIVLDLIFGVAAGFLFGAVWGRTNFAAGASDADGTSLRKWFIARAWLVAAFGFLFLWLTMLFYASAWLLSHDLWNNPGPMLVGVFVKTLLASRIGLSTGSHDVEVQRHGLTAWLTSNLDWLCLLPIVVWAAVLLFSH